MAQTESMSIVTLDPVSKKMDMKDSQPTKKLIQPRLPFMPIDHEQKTLKTTTPPGSKKRKLSDNDTPSPKLAKVLSQPPKPTSPDGDAEVSSSSEAEPAPHAGHQKGGKRFSTLDRFLFKKREEHHEEISSTNDCIPMSIDLTDDAHESDNVDSANDNNSAISVHNVNGDKDVKDTDTTKRHVDHSKIKEKDDIHKDSEVAVTKKETDEVKNDIKKTEQSLAPEKAEKISENKIIDKTVDKENKENIDQEVVSIDDENEIDQSFVSDTSVCEAALKTPAKDKPLESVLKTPVVVEKKDVASPAIQSPGTTSNDTPKSAGKKRSSKPLSASKQKEKEALRLQREKEKEEKRLQKEREKEEKEKERLEKKRQKDEEKAEKERIKQEEKDKKEKERLEKIQQKEEEKKKKEEQLLAKQEEKRKKEEEKKAKEEEKKLKEEEKQKEEEDKLKKKEKLANSFKSFFIEKAPAVSPPKVKEGKSQFFMPFEMKPNMRLAPTRRVENFPTEAKESLDQCLLKQDSDTLYLGQLRSGAIEKRKSGKTFQRELVEEKDIEIMCHDAETIKKTMHKVKFLKFAENNRPPYYGTYTKPSTTLSARNPFKQDEALFDYEVDSDDEWEEEDPGESVSSDEEDDEKDKDKDEEDDDENDWMVPHGYLSDDEGIPDEEVDVAKRKQLQEAKQEAWEREIKMQTQPLKMISLGCVWEGETTAIAAKQLEKLLSFKAVCLSTDPIPTSFIRSEVLPSSSRSEPGTPRLGLKKAVPEEAMPDLIRLVHGNPVGVKKLIREFRMFWKLKTSGDTGKKDGPTDQNDSIISEQPKSQGDDGESSINDVSMEVDGNADAPNTPPNDKADSQKTENQLDFAISKTQLEAKIKEIAIRDKRNDDKVPCWYVKDDILKEYGQADIKLPNSWEYVEIKAPTWASTNKATPKIEEAAGNKPIAPSGRATPTIPSITQFTQAMSPAQIQAQKALASPSVAKPATKTLDPKPADKAVEVIDSKVETTIEEKPTIPKDQNTIMSFFKRATSTKLGTGKVEKAESVEKGASRKADSVIDTNGDINEKSGQNVNDNSITEMKSSTPGDKKECLKVVKQIKRNCAVLLEKLDQPSEKVLKVMPVPRTDIEESKSQGKQEAAEDGGKEKQKGGYSDGVEPMETDVIVLD